MKIAFKLDEHKNDKNTGFAGSLHAAAWLGALALLKTQVSAEQFAHATQWMRSDIWFRHPVRSDFSVATAAAMQNSAAAGLGDGWQIHNQIEDSAGVQVEAKHQGLGERPDWVLVPRISQLSPQPALIGALNAPERLSTVMQTLQHKFAVVPALALAGLHWCSTPSAEPGLQVRLQPGSDFPYINSLAGLQQQILLGYVAGWSLVSALTSEFAQVDVLVSRVFAFVDYTTPLNVLLNKQEDQTSSQSSQLPIMAILAKPNSENNLLEQLHKHRSARAEVLVRSGNLLMKGVFHAKY